MQGLTARALTAIAFGLVALGATSAAALAESNKEYRIIGCEEPFNPGSPSDPPPPQSFNVIFSSVPEEVGQPCEDVMTSLGAQGFRLVDFREARLNYIGRLHYLERHVKK